MSAGAVATEIAEASGAAGTAGATGVTDPAYASRALIFFSAAAARSLARSVNMTSRR